MGRLSDAMGAIFLGYATLHHFERNRGSVKGLEALAESSMQQLEHEAQFALRECAENFPKPLGAIGGWMMSAGIAPLGEMMRPYRMPRDALTQEVSHLLTTPSEVHKMFADNVYMASGGVSGDNRVAELIHAMPICLQADAALMSCKKEKREPTSDEAKLIMEADGLREKLVQVDVHEALGPLEEADAAYERPALVSTQLRKQQGAANFEQAISASA